MCRVKEGRVTKPGLRPGGGTASRRRGRPAINWTRSRKRRLLSLYLCTPESELSLKRILALLAEGPFQPKPRHTQSLLNEMLSRSYRQKRPRNRTSMSERMAYLRAARDGRLETDPQAAPRPEVVEACAILLKSDPCGGKCPSTKARGTSGEADGCDSPSSLSDQRPDTASNPISGPGDMAEPRTSLESEAIGAEDATGVMFKDLWTPGEEARAETIEFLRGRCPSRSSSFLADVASLMDGLSIRSSASRSSSCSSRRRTGSFSSIVEPSAAGTHGEGVADLGGFAEPGSIADSRAWEVDAPAGTDSSPASVDQKGRDLHELSSPSHTLENRELVRFCCSKTSWCVHQRINGVLVHGDPADAFRCTVAEANSRDGLGNTTLHVAARWGAPWPVLMRIMALATDLGAANHLGETFLHVLDPAALSFGDLAQLAQYLASRGFDFTRLDMAGRSFVDRLMARPLFSLESLETVFLHLGEPARLALLYRHTPGHPRHLLSIVRSRLLKQAPTAPSAAASPQAEEAAAQYCAYFEVRYGTAPPTGRPG